MLNCMLLQTAQCFFSINWVHNSSQILGKCLFVFFHSPVLFSNLFHTLLTWSISDGKKSFAYNFWLKKLLLWALSNKMDNVFVRRINTAAKTTLLHAQRNQNNKVGPKNKQIKDKNVWPYILKSNFFCYLTFILLKWIQPYSFL